MQPTHKALGAGLFLSTAVLATLAAQGVQTGGGVSRALVCADALVDQNGGPCLQASSTPTPGLLFPPPHDGGVDNTASGPYAFVGGGRNNTASGQYATVSGGGGLAPTDGNVASGRRATVSGGAGNTADGWYASIGGGVATGPPARTRPWEAGTTTWPTTPPS